jgi:hypothetical protein
VVTICDPSTSSMSQCRRRSNCPAVIFECDRPFGSRQPGQIAAPYWFRRISGPRLGHTDGVGSSPMILTGAPFHDPHRGVVTVTANEIWPDPTACDSGNCPRTTGL